MRDKRLERILSRMTSGTMGGQSRVASQAGTNKLLIPGIQPQSYSSYGPAYFYGFANNQVLLKTYSFTSREIVEFSAVQDTGVGPLGEWAVFSEELGSFIDVPGMGPYQPTADSYEYVTLPPGNYTGATGEIQFSATGNPHIGTWEAGLDLYNAYFQVVETDTQYLNPIPTWFGGSTAYYLTFSLPAFTVGTGGGYMSMHVDGTGPANEINDISGMQVNFDSLIL